MVQSKFFLPPPPRNKVQSFSKRVTAGRSKESTSTSDTIHNSRLNITFQFILLLATALLLKLSCFFQFCPCQHSFYNTRFGNLKIQMMLHEMPTSLAIIWRPQQTAILVGKRKRKEKFKRSNMEKIILKLFNRNMLSR
jgi:hypothetical protein